MAILKIARMGHPALLAPSQPVTDPTAPEIKRLARDMIETMIDADGAGLAAPQVHIPLRLVIFHAPASRSEDKGEEYAAPLTILANPSYEVLGTEKEGGWEGCLSAPGLRGYVERVTHLRYTGLDLDGRTITREAKGFHARVIQHECDHLDGVLYIKRVGDLSKLIFESEMRHWLEQDVEL